MKYFDHSLNVCMVHVYKNHLTFDSHTNTDGNWGLKAKLVYLFDVCAFVWQQLMRSTTGLLAYSKTIIT